MNSLEQPIKERVRQWMNKRQASWREPPCPEDIRRVLGWAAPAVGQGRRPVRVGRNACPEIGKANAG